MALRDLHPVDLSNGVRLFPYNNLTVRIVNDKQLNPEQASIEAEANFRKAFKVSQIDLLPAKFKEVDYELNYGTQECPAEYYKPEIKPPADEEVEYDVDEEDLIWLEEKNKRRALKKNKKISDEMFEQTIDRLEKETYFKNVSNDTNSMDGSEPLDDDCCICGNGDVENVNQIIYCDMCNIAVHQDCYGVPYIPEGQWLCRKCKLSPMEQVKCELCPLRDGAFKPTSDGKWAHVACAIWLNEVHFGNTAFLEPIEGVQYSLRRRAKLRCLVCKVKGGACLQCSKGSCVKAFHVTCAMKARLQMVVDTVEDAKSPDGVDVKRFVYCHVHGSVSVGDNEFAKNKKRAIEAIHRARRKMMNTASASSCAPVPTVDEEAKKRIEELIGDKSAVEEIMGFWFYKRKMRCGLPLIRRLQIKKKKAEQKTTPRGEAKKMGRIMYEKARLLIELMQKREKNFLENIIMEKQLIPVLLTPLDETLVEFINSIIHIDRSEFFTADPLKQGLPNYASLVKKPMDLSKMKSNARKGVYKAEKDMKDHLDLIFKNCEIYNASNEGVLNYSRKTQKLMNKAYGDLVEYLKFIRQWSDMLNLTGEKPCMLDLKKDRKEELPDESMGAPTPREESNRRKRRAESRTEDTIETPLVKREKRTRDREKAAPTPATPIAPHGPSVFLPSTLTPRPPKPFSPPRLDSNSNKSQRRQTRHSTQSSFNNFREIPSVLSPEMGVTSCDSADSDMEVAPPSTRSQRVSLSDRNTLHHNDLVKVNGKAGLFVSLSDASLEKPDIFKQYSQLAPADGNDDVLVKHFTSPQYARYKPSCVALLDPDSDEVEGIREAKEYYKMICSK